MATRFFGFPTRGGQLTVLNCAFWLLFVLFAKYANPSPPSWAVAMFIPSVLVFSFPVAIWCFLPQLDYSPTLWDIIRQSVLIGVNSFVWGYGLSFVIRKLRGHRRRPAA